MKAMKYNKGIVGAFYRDQGLPDPIFEYRFHDTRKWKFDICFWPNRVAIEVQGGLFVQGRHTRGAALLKEYEKLNEAAKMGWRIIYLQPKDLCLTETVKLIKECL